MEDDDWKDLPIGEVVVESERMLTELSAEEIAKYRHPERNPRNVEFERIAELRRLQRGG